MGWEREVEEIRRRREFAAGHGGEAAVAKQHARGRQTVRERIDALVDAGSFREQGSVTGVSEQEGDGTLRHFTPANAVMGTAKLDDRPVVVCGDDFTLRGAAYSSAGMRKAEYADVLAARRRVPIIRMLEAGGASVSGITGVKGRSGYDFVGNATSNRSVVEARSQVPMVSAALGPVAGYAAARLVASHFSIMTREGAQVLTGGPVLVKRATGEDVSKEELGGAQVHGRSGVVNNVAEDEADVWRQIRAFLSYLPSSVWQTPPVQACEDPRDRADAELLEMIPAESRRPYKIRRVIASLVDRDSFFELTPGYGRTQVTGLARLDGHPVGVFANDPYVYGGSMTATGAQKVRRFIELCDAFHLPLLSLMDEPGFMIGTQAEKDATIRFGMEAMFAVQQSRVPWFTVILRKSFGVAAGIHLGPNGLVMAWPSAQSGSMPLEGGVALAHRSEIEAAEDPDARRSEIEAEYASAQSVFPRAEDFGVHDLIDPRETRARMADWVEEVQPQLAGQCGPTHYTARP
ncbi:MAG: propionyl-CoA carboxylase [Myxococcales bacterium]|nr:propionyl-CoA carboxylase [Myxococcales bacterium]